MKAAENAVEKPPLDALTGIRFFAALHVVVYHFATKTAGFEALPRTARQFILAGPSSVGLFFVLSGFILSYNYADRPAAAAEFWAARFARIYPLYITAFLLFAPFAFVKYHSSPPKLLLIGLVTATLMQAWTDMAVNWNAPGWSLSAELFFYLLFPFVLGAIGNVSRRRSLVYLAVLSALGLIAPVAYAAGYIAHNTWHGWLMYNPLIWLPAFLLGMVMERSGIRTGRNWGLAAAGGILISFAVCPVTGQELLSHGALFLPFGVLISSLTTWTTVLSTPKCVLLGQASYGLYILHLPLWNLTVGVFTWLTTGQQTDRAPHISVLLAYLIFSVWISIVCFERIEQPARRWLRRRMAPRAGAPLSPHRAVA